MVTSFGVHEAAAHVRRDIDLGHQDGHGAAHGATGAEADARRAAQLVDQAVVIGFDLELAPAGPLLEAAPAPSLLLASSAATPTTRFQPSPRPPAHRHAGHWPWSRWSPRARWPSKYGRTGTAADGHGEGVDGVTAVCGDGHVMRLLHDGGWPTSVLRPISARVVGQTPPPPPTRYACATHADGTGTGDLVEQLRVVGVHRHVTVGTRRAPRMAASTSPSNTTTPTGAGDGRATVRRAPARMPFCADSLDARTTTSRPALTAIVAHLRGGAGLEHIATRAPAPPPVPTPPLKPKLDSTWWLVDLTRTSAVATAPRSG